MSIPTQITDIEKRYDFLLVFDVTDGNPNGDPDAGNLPRLDPETMHGIVTDVCLKRKIRNFVALTHSPDRDQLDQANGNGIYVRDSGVALNNKLREAHVSLHPEHADLSKLDKKTTDRLRKTAQLDSRAEVCRRYFDVRTFGGVLSTGDYNCGQVRGPVQLTFGRSVDPIIPTDVSITRVAITKEGEDKETEMGRKASVPYGLYITKGYFSPMLAKDTGLNSEDLKLFWTAVRDMFENDRSASRGDMRLQEVYIFRHEDPLGNAHAGKLFDRIQYKLRGDVASPRKYADYDLYVDDQSFPEGISLVKLLG